MTNTKLLVLKEYKGKKFLKFNLWNKGNIVTCVAFDSNATYIYSLKKDKQPICIQGELKTTKEHIAGLRIYGYYVLVKKVDFIFDKDDDKKIMKNDFRNALYEFEGEI